jgi:acetyl-CoA synthetase
VPDFTWSPSPAVIEHANVTRLVRRAGVRDYAELLERSQNDPEWFWPLVVSDLQLEFSKPWTRVVDQEDGPEWAKWFVGGRINIASTCVHRWARAGRRGEVAAVFAGEDGARREFTFADLGDAVTRLAEGLAELGVRQGDVVALYLPMSPEVAIASHACAHLGAIQMPAFSGFAAPALAARLIDSGAKVVITADGSLRRGREQHMKATVDEALQEAPSVEHVVVWRRLGTDVSMRDGRDVYWDELVAHSAGTLEPLEVDAETPYLLTYTSGTTGKPKGVVHVHGGFLVSIAREVAYQADAHPDDVLHFATDMGWIMGPWTVVGGGAAGCRIVYTEGAPDWPEDRLWSLIEHERVSILGCSPTLIRALIPHGEPEADLSSLRVIVTTGEPWNPEPYRWLAHNVGGSRCPIINCSGGTEVGACFLSPTPVIPIKGCSLGWPALGMAMDVIDSEGNSVRGEVGELVCRKPFPGMTRGFWRDSERYLDTYWRRVPGLWVHGDWASVDADGYWFLHGRSDDTLNIAGKRIGPAELESAAVSHPAVQEAAAIGVPHPVKGEVAWLFCVLVPPHESTQQLARNVSATVVDELGAAFRPDRVVFVAALPKTRSAKIVRRAIRGQLLDGKPGDLSSLENPDSLRMIAEQVVASPHRFA